MCVCANAFVRYLHASCLQLPRAAVCVRVYTNARVRTMHTVFVDGHSDVYAGVYVLSVLSVDRGFFDKSEINFSVSGNSISL